MKPIILFYLLLLSTIAFGQKKVKETSQSQQEAVALCDSAVELWRSHKYDEALTVADVSLSLARQQKDTLQSAKCLNNIGLIYSSKGDAVKSIFYYEQSLALLRLINNQQELYTSLLNLGIAYKEKAIYDKALRYLFEAEEYFSEVKDDKKLSATYNTIGNVFMLEKSYDKALEFHKKALKIRQNIGYDKGIAGSINNIGIVYKKVDNYDSAMVYFDEALKLKELNSSPENLANTLSHIAEIYVIKKQYKAAKNYYMRAYYLRDSFENKKGIAHSFYELGYLSYTEGNLTNAGNYLIKAITKSKEIGASDVLLRSYNLLRQLYRKTKKLSKALLYDDLYIELYEKLLGEESKALLAQMQIKYETEKKQDEIEQLNYEKEKREAVLVNQQLRLEVEEANNRILIIVVVLVGMISVLLAYLYRSNRRFSAKLGEVMREMHHRIKNNFQVLLSIFSLQKEHIDDEIVKGMVESNIQRIGAMGQIHQDLYESKDLTKMKLADYIHTLVNNLQTVYAAQKQNIKVNYDIDRNIEMEVDKAISLALLINELVTNAFKYAFDADNKNPILNVVLKRNQRYELIIKDNGNSITPNNTFKKSFGLKLVESQVKRLKGVMTKNNTNGMEYKIVF